MDNNKFFEFEKPKRSHLSPKDHSKSQHDNDFDLTELIRDKHRRKREVICEECGVVTMFPKWILNLNELGAFIIDLYCPDCDNDTPLKTLLKPYRSVQKYKTFQFGKYKDHRISEVIETDIDYVLWMFNNSNDEDFMTSVFIELEIANAK